MGTFHIGQVGIQTTMAASSSSTSINTSAYAGAREPTPDEWSTMQDLGDILDWAKLKGSAEHLPSQRGSLLTALGADAQQQRRGG